MKSLSQFSLLPNFLGLLRGTGTFPPIANSELSQRGSTRLEGLDGRTLGGICLAISPNFRGRSEDCSTTMRSVRRLRLFLASYLCRINRKENSSCSDCGVTKLQDYNSPLTGFFASKPLRRTIFGTATSIVDLWCCFSPERQCVYFICVCKYRIIPFYVFLRISFWTKRSNSSSSSSGPNLEGFPDYWLFVDLLFAPIPWKFR